MNKRGFRELNVYKAAYKAAMEIVKLSKSFSKEETYSLTDQVRRSSRSVCANIAESYRKRLYPKSFVSKLTDSDAECAETTVHLDFALDCGYITRKQHEDLINEYEQVGKMLGTMINHPERFAIKKLPTAAAD